MKITIIQTHIGLLDYMIHNTRITKNDTGIIILVHVCVCKLDDQWYTEITSGRFTITLRQKFSAAIIIPHHLSLQRFISYDIYHKKVIV